MAVLSTGNELIPPGETLKPGQIRDSNKTALLTLLDERGFPAVDSGIAIDEFVCSRSREYVHKNVGVIACSLFGTVRTFC